MESLMESSVIHVLCNRNIESVFAIMKHEYGAYCKEFSIVILRVVINRPPHTPLAYQWRLRDGNKKRYSGRPGVYA